MYPNEKWHHNLSGIQNTRIVEDLKKLIRIPSTFGQEDRIAKHLHRKLRKLTPTCKEIPVPSHGSAILADIGSSEENAPTILLSGHMDTVPVCYGWKSKPYQPLVVGEKLYGLGALDMKGGLACVLAAFEALSAIGDELPGRVRFLAVPDEEGWSQGMNTVLDKRLLTDVNAAIIAEPSGTQNLIIGRRGRLIIELVVKGTMSHAAIASKENAIMIAGNILNHLNNLPLGSDPVFKVSGSITPLKIAASTEALSNPDRCYLTLDRHYLPQENPGLIVKEFKQYLQSLGMNNKVELKLGTRPTPPPYPYLLNNSHALPQTLIETIRQSTGRPPMLRIGESVADENFLFAKRIPVVAYGPGGENAHGPNEYVKIPDLETVAKIYALAALNFLKQQATRSVAKKAKGPPSKN